MIISKKAKVELAKEAYEAKKMKKHYEDIEQAALEKLKTACKEQSFAAEGYAFTKTVRAGGVDYTSVVRDFKLDVSSYRKEDVVMWRLSYEQ